MTDISSAGDGLQPLPFKWTRELADKIALLWPTKSATEIAAIIWLEDRIALTRNAVVGKLHRLKLTINDKTGTTVRTRTGYRQRTVPQIPRAVRVNVQSINAARTKTTSAIAFLDVMQTEVSPRHLSFAELDEQTCKWPYGSEPSEFTFCGDMPIEGRPYCLAHCRASYQAPSLRMRRGEP